MIYKYNKHQFYIEAGASKRKGIFNHRVKVSDKGRRDYQRQRTYTAELKADGNIYFDIPSKLFAQYITVGIIDDLVNTSEFIRLFGATRLLVEFSTRRKKSEASRSIGSAKISFRNSETLFPLDIFHELTHTITLTENEPAHGERFAKAMLLITELSEMCNDCGLAQFYNQKQVQKGKYEYNK